MFAVWIRCSKRAVTAQCRANVARRASADDPSGRARLRTSRFRTSGQKLNPANRERGRAVLAAPRVRVRSRDSPRLRRRPRAAAVPATRQLARAPISEDGTAPRAAFTIREPGPGARRRAVITHREHGGRRAPPAVADGSACARGGLPRRALDRQFPGLHRPAPPAGVPRSIDTTFKGLDKSRNCTGSGGAKHVPRVGACAVLKLNSPEPGSELPAISQRTQGFRAMPDRCGRKLPYARLTHPQRLRVVASGIAAALLGLAFIAVHRSRRETTRCPTN
jgi:hypothetical protein